MRRVALLLCLLALSGCPDLRSYSYLRAEESSSYRVRPAWTGQPTNEDVDVDFPFGSSYRIYGRDEGAGLYLRVTAELAALESAHFAVDYVLLTCATGGDTRVPFASARSVTVTNLDSNGFGRPFDVDASVAMSENFVGPLYRGSRQGRQRYQFELPVVGCDPKPVVVTLPPIVEASTTTAAPPIKFFLAKFRYVGLQPVQ